VVLTIMAIIYVATVIIPEFNKWALTTATFAVVTIGVWFVNKPRLPSDSGAQGATASLTMRSRDLPRGTRMREWKITEELVEFLRTRTKDLEAIRPSSEK
jgi:hypothetical protein